MQNEASTDYTIIRMPAVKAMVGLSNTCIYERIARKEFPKSLPLGGGAVGWLKSEVEGWVKERVEARNSGATLGASEAQEVRK